MIPRAACWGAGIALLSCAGLACASPRTQESRLVTDSRGEILWDIYGVQHIFAGDRNALAYGWGWAQMQNHGDLLLRLYAQARGRAAELIGPSYLNEDRWVWTTGVPQRSQAWLEAQPPETRAHIAAFVRGVNAFAAAHPELIGDSLRTVLPVVESDVMGHIQRWMFSAFVTSRSQVEQRSDPWKERGSNAWAIAPSRSASGHALLLANPHLPWSDMFTWMEAQHVIPGANIYGAALIGSPVLQIAFNDCLGWTHTVNTQDGEDLYELTLTGNGYAWDGGARPFAIERHVLSVRDSAGALRPETLMVRRSLHGPVVSESPGRALALRVVGLELSGHIEQWWRMGTARNLAEFESAIRPNMISSQNITYADADGHVMFFYGGNTPVRSLGDRAYWAGVVPGTRSANLWTRLHAFVDMPLIVDPPTGWLQNANDPPWWATFPAMINREGYPDYLASLEMSLRAQRSVAMIDGDPSITLDELIAHKHATEMELANRVLSDLLSSAENAGSDAVRQAAAVLERWDRRSDAGSSGAVLFVDWWGEYERRMRGRSLFSTRWSASAPRTTPRGLADKGVAVAALEVAAQRVVTRYRSLEVPWGDVYRARRDTLDLPSNGAPHEYGVFRTITYRATDDNRFTVAGGDSYVAAIEFGPEVRAMSVIAYGNASRTGSPHRADQLTLFAQQRMKPVWRTRAAIEQNLSRRELF